MMLIGSCRISGFSSFNMLASTSTRAAPLPGTKRCQPRTRIVVTVAAESRKTVIARDRHRQHNNSQADWNPVAAGTHADWKPVAGKPLLVNQHHFYLQALNYHHLVLACTCDLASLSWEVLVLEVLGNIYWAATKHRGV